ncbi:hypothetical protein NQ317_004513 [Molorchus minor]|uniref:Uncharacterized protein n=1 Tax=Molorchus minor TaxID=1323400 RepID=A0ABQ9JXX3_9CUCU|nr:hypothetical protein NQ317_004513 [Molorchus minor]
MICFIVEESLNTLNLYTERQLNEKIKKVEVTWDTKLKNQLKESDAILKECQAISEYSIIQCELEKSKVKNELIEKTKELENVQSKYSKISEEFDELNVKYKNLQSNLSSIIIELNVNKENINRRDRK